MDLFRSFGAACCSHIQRTFLGKFGTSHYTRMFNNLKVLYKCQLNFQSIKKKKKSEIQGKVFIICTHVSYLNFKSNILCF
jgi:hypothetical protein